VAPREAVRITTGAPVPEGADAVLPAEEGEESGGSLEARGAVTPGRHVGAAGEDVRAGSTVLAVGRRLRPQDLGLLSSIGRAAVAVVRRPRVQIIVTGSEVLPAGRPAEGPRVPDANGPMLEALVTRDGGEPVSGPPVPDDPDAIGAALDASDEEVVLVSGGSSVGEEDHVPSVLARRGVLAFHGVSMRPSSPTGAGTIRGRPVFLLPGNPVSCLCAYDFFAGRAIRRLGGRPAEWPYRAARLPLARKIASALGRTDFVRVRVEGGRIEPLMTRGAGILSSAVEADGFVVVPRDSEGYAPGTVVEAFLYDS
jgi:molybdopterin molybdotransferase